MKYILIIVSAPEYGDSEGHRAWEGFVQRTNSLEPKDAESRKLGEGAWLLVRDSEPSILAKIIAAAEGARRDYKVLYLAAD